MASAALLLPPQAAYTDEPIYRLTVDQYHDLIDRGTLTSDDPVELIEGMLVFKMPKNEAHIASVRRCRRAVETLLPSSYFYDAEQPLTLSDGEPEPDGMIVKGKIEDFDAVKVKPSNVELIIEVSDSTLDRDRGITLRSYARASVSCYWIVNLLDHQIEVYTDPDPLAPVPSYRQMQVFRFDEMVLLSLGGQAIGQIAVSDVFQPANAV